MPNHLRFSNPDAIAKPPGYSHVVEVIGPGRLVYFAGQLGMDKSGKMGANIREQMELAFENLKAALASVGATFDHVSRSTIISSISAPTSRSSAKCGTNTSILPRRQPALRLACQSWHARALCSRSRRSRSCRRSEGPGR